jgi:hypothetical protein
MVLETSEDSAKDTLVNVLRESGVSTDFDTKQLRQRIVTIKEAINKYETASRALSKYLGANAASDESETIRKTRINLVYMESREALNALNKRLVELGAESASSIGEISLVGAPPNTPSEHENNVNEDINEQPLGAPADNITRECAMEDLQAQIRRLQESFSALPMERRVQARQMPSGGDEEETERLDPISRRQLRQDLLKGMDEPFSGVAEYFWCWYHQLERRLHECEAGALDSIHILKANTEGRPNKIVTTHLLAGASRPKDTLHRLLDELKTRFGSNSLVSGALLDKVSAFPQLKSNQTERMEDLLDLCMVIQANMDFCGELSLFNLQKGMKIVYSRLPDAYQMQWRKQLFYLEEKQKRSPIFQDFITHFESYIKEMRIPGFFEDSMRPAQSKNNRQFKTLHTEVKSRCAFHKASGHLTTDCSAFKKLSLNDKRDVAKKNGLCYGCLGSHRIVDCPRDIECTKCGKPHSTLMHRDSWENDYNNHPKADKKSNCITVCGDAIQGKICSKTLLIDVKAANSNKILRCLCILDDQSNSSFCDPKLLDFFNLDASPENYTLTTMTGFQTEMKGQLVKGLQVKGVHQHNWLCLPGVLTNSCIPDSKAEMVTPKIVLQHSHLKHLASKFPEEDKTAEVLLLIGADCGQAMHINTYGHKVPYVHETPLGWSLVGPACKGKNQLRFKSLKTELKKDQCEHYNAVKHFDNSVSNPTIPHNFNCFKEQVDDDLLGLSRSDQKFQEVINQGIKVNKQGNLEMPLPLKETIVFPNNKLAVELRTKNTLHRVTRNDFKMQQCLEIMKKYLEKGHVTRIPDDELQTKGLVNYIPVFAVTNQKKSKVRLVFDSSASYAGTSLNDNLLQGPDENNRIIGVLTRFRNGQVGFSADIECMFHAFYVTPEHRDLLRFFWWDENDTSKRVVPYRANVHVFGNCCSPAIAIHGLRHTASQAHAEQFPEARELIKNNFYVDDALGAADSPMQAIKMIQDTRAVLSKFNIRLHKISSSSPEVLAAFPMSELGEKAEVIDLTMSGMQRTLGIIWNTSSDSFTIHCNLPIRSLTKRGILSTINSLYDPLGFVCPIVLGGRLLQRKIIPPKHQDRQETEEYNWDDPLPHPLGIEWSSWVSLLNSSDERISVPRSFNPPGFGSVLRTELHTFSDASDNAIGIVIYMRMINKTGQVNVTFLYGNSKVSPKAATTIPRLELNAAVEAAQSTNYMKLELCQTVDDTVFHCDSKVVLGYLNNTEKRFSRYVTNRVETILKTTTPQQWHYVKTDRNPADIASRPQTPESLLQSSWFSGPNFLWQGDITGEQPTPSGDVELPEVLKPAKVLVSSSSTGCRPSTMILAATNDWKKALKMMSSLISFLNLWLYKRKKRSHLIQPQEAQRRAQTLILIETQTSVYPEAYNRLKNKSMLDKSDDLLSLAPFLDQNSLMRVGGRLRHSNMGFQHKHPILLPPRHPATTSIVNYYHDVTYHQGRHILQGKLQQAGFHIHRSRATIGKILANCVTCKRLRGPLQEQLMSDLPPDRLEECPPFTNTGIDTFGPYLVHDGAHTRRTNANKKIWGLLFTCLVSRAIHIEPLASLDSATVRLALRRFLAIRGQCKIIRSDQGTNFIGAKNEMATEIDGEDLKKFARDSDIIWKLNTPGASHTGGVWERKIGSFKNVLRASLLQLGPRNLSRCELHTLFQECTAIVNNTPLYEVSSDPNDPIAITPAMLLTLKTQPNPAPLESFSEADLLCYGRARWRRIMHLSEQFWLRWRQNYITQLQARKKWMFPRRSPKVNDVVLIKENSPRNVWPLARVKKVDYSTDNLVRTITLQVPGKLGKERILRRCLQDTVLLIPVL